jgi:hypothetical protein
MARLIGTQLPGRLTVALDHQDPCRAARSRLEAQRPAAGKQIEATLAVKALTEPVKERFPHAVGRRTQAVEVEDRQRCALPVAANDADGVRFAAVRRSSWRAGGRRTRHADSNG